MIEIKEYNLDDKKRANSEAVEAVNQAISLVEGKNGYKCGNEKTWNAELGIYWGHNIYTTSIRLDDKNRISSAAYFCDGTFWLCRCAVQVELF